MTYDGSQLAELNGGFLSSRMFFIYNRIDTSQANKLENIIQIGEHSCIVGNVKSKYVPPGDVPDEAYGEALIKFREHIHQQVVSNVEGKAWESTTVDKFAAYIKEVWSCICSANFNLNFATVIERMAFDQLDIEYKLKEQELSEAYMESFKKIKKEMRKVNEKESAGVTFAGKSTASSDISNNNNGDFSVSFIAKFNDAMSPTLMRLDEEVNVIVKAEGGEKWSAQFLQMWKLNKKEQQEIWKNNVKNAFNRIFLYEQSLESYKRRMRQEINEFFELPKSE
jgi:hypothetical protein